MLYVKLVMSKMAVSLFILIGLALLQTGFSLGNDAVPSNEDCVSRQELAEMQSRSRQELAAVKAEMQSQVDQLHSQLHYWQNTTLNILKDHYTATNSGPATECKMETYDSEVLQNITQSTNERLEQLQNAMEQLQTASQVCHAMTGSFHNPARSCSHIVQEHPNATSGDYWLQSGPNYAVQVYCDMERVCGCGGEGGWMRVADIDMTRNHESCPGSLRLYQSSGKRLCGRTGVGCNSVHFNSLGIEYSRVCGRVIAYQFATVDGLYSYCNRHTTLDGTFLDGVVLTHGSPRNHIWSFIANYYQGQTGCRSCPCSVQSGFSGAIPHYINNDYFCDSGISYTGGPRILYSQDPLWDGAGCGNGNNCCEFNSPPWFCKDLPTSTSDDIELRICGDQDLNDEDTPIEMVEIYVQ